MKLIRRNLKLDLTGDDVRLLQSELILLGLPIPKAEQDRAAFLKGTYEAVVRFQREHTLKPTGVVNAETARSINAAVSALPRVGTSATEGGGPPPPTAGSNRPYGLTLLGHVVNDGEQPLAGLQVRALRKALRHEKPLGQTISASDGTYRIQCEDESHPSPTVVCVYDGAREVARSRLICESRGDVMVDILVRDQKFRMPPEYDRVTRLVAPLVTGAPIVGLSDEDLDVLSCAGGLSRDLLVALRAAAQIVQGSDVPVSAVYGMLRLGLPLTRSGLLAEPERVCAAALAGAVARRIVDALSTDQINRILALMRTLSVDNALAPPSDGSASISSILATVLPEPALQRAVLTAYVAHEGTSEEFWTKTLANVPGFGDVQTRDRLRFVVGLAAITLGHAPLVSALLAAKWPRRVSALRDLAWLSEGDWAALIAKTGVPDGVPGSTPAERQSTYASNVAQIVAEAFPTAVVGAQLAQNDYGASRTVAHFLEANPDFDLGTTSLNRYLTAHPNAGAALGVAGRSGLEQTQRLFKVTSNAKEIVALQTAGFGSAWTMTRLSATEFAAKMTSMPGGGARARELHAAATSRMETALYLMATYKDLLASTGTPATPPPSSTLSVGGTNG